jgi:hypothetical protein
MLHRTRPERTNLDRTRLRRTAAAVCAALLVGLAGCSDDDSSSSAPAPATIETVGTEKRITLTADAARRIALETTSITTQAGASVIPYSAVVYDAEGATWAYTSAGPLVFVRAPIEVDRIDGDVAILRRSPAAGTEVVTVGAAMLYGVETGVGK